MHTGRALGSLAFCAALLVVFSSMPNRGYASSSVTGKGAQEAFKKISKAPLETEDEVEIDEGDHGETVVLKPAVKSAPAPGSETESMSGATPHETTEHKAAPHDAKSHGKAHASSGVSGEQSLKWLMNGNVRYLNKRLRADGRGSQDRQRLLAGQKPHAIVLSCSDSRVPPEIVFDQALGEIFVIRVAGEALDSSVIASIEYAVEHLGPRLLVVMGHTKCGAVDTALKVKEGSSAGSESLDRLLADIRPRLKTVAEKKRTESLDVESALNADGVARDLLQRSTIVRQKVESGELLIKPALYRLDSGKVSFY